MRIRPWSIPIANSVCGCWPAAILHSGLCPGQILVQERRRPMSPKLAFFAAVVLAALVAAPAVNAQIESGLHARPRITRSIDEMDRVALAGNTHPEARAANDRGCVADDFVGEHMCLQLDTSP